MNEDFKIEISKIVSLAGDPGAILPHLHALRSSQTYLQNESLSEVIVKSEPFQEIAEEVSEGSTEQPSKKKQCRSKNSVTLSENDFKYRPMTGKELLLSIQGDRFIDFCQEHKLIATHVSCFCGNGMRLGYKSVSDGCGWTCYAKVHKNKPRLSIRKGTWFENANLTIADILWIAYMWMHEYSAISMLHESDNSQTTIIEWCDNCLNLCQAIMEKKQDPIGGSSKSVEIYECKVINEGSSEKWAFCAIELHSTNLLNLIVDNKKPKTVFRIIDKYIIPGTTLVTQNWSPLKTLIMEDFTYLRNRKSISFFDLSTRKDIDTFKDFKRATNRLPSGESKLVYGVSFLEIMYRKSLDFATDKYLTFLRDISLVYKPAEEFVIDFTTDKSAAAVKEKEDTSL